MLDMSRPRKFSVRVGDSVMFANVDADRLAVVHSRAGTRVSPGAGTTVQFSVTREPGMVVMEDTSGVTVGGLPSTTVTVTDADAER